MKLSVCQKPRSVSEGKAEHGEQPLLPEVLVLQVMDVVYYGLTRFHRALSARPWIWQGICGNSTSTLPIIRGF